MSNPDLQVLLQLNQLRRDVAGHDFVWQVLALLLCLGLAYFLAHRWLRWRREQAEPARRLGQIGARLHNPEIDPAQTSAYSVEDTAYREFYVKMSKVRDQMLTSVGRQMAEHRHTFMEAFFRQLTREVGGTSP